MARDWSGSGAWKAAGRGRPAAEGAAHVVRLVDPATEIVDNGAYFDRDQGVAPAPAATEDRADKRLSKLADLLVGHMA